VTARRERERLEGVARATRVLAALRWGGGLFGRALPGRQDRPPGG
jgi:hypothetical protein